MLQIISPNSRKILLENINPQTNVEKLNNYIKDADCKYMSVDISNINLMDACMISTLCSTQHYLKYPDGKINWIINDSVIEDFTSLTSLENTDFINL